MSYLFFTRIHEQDFSQVEGRIKLNISGTNAVSKTVKTVDEQYELWSCHSPNASGSSTCPRTIPFSAVVPPTFKDGDREFPLPPSYEVNFTGENNSMSSGAFLLTMVYRYSWTVCEMHVRHPSNR